MQSRWPVVRGSDLVRTALSETQPRPRFCAPPGPCALPEPRPLLVRCSRLEVRAPSGQSGPRRAVRTFATHPAVAGALPARSVEADADRDAEGLSLQPRRE